MFLLYICSYHLAEYRTLGQKTIKCITVQLWGGDLVCLFVYECAIIQILTKYVKIYDVCRRCV